MRFSELRLIKYGHFESCTLMFPYGEPDLHLVYGPNEAGKTTTLCAIRDLLFGFSRKANQDYRFDRGLLRVGAVISGEAGDLVFRRKRGDVRTLLDEAESPLSNGILAPYLHGYDADAFERMFSLDHARLRRGGSEIIAGEGAVGEAIFSAGAGLAGVARLCDELEAEAKNIWTRNKAQGRRYYVAQNAHDDARSRLREALVKPAKWEAARREYTQATAAVDATQSEFDRILTDQSANERKRRLILPVSQLAERRRQLSELGPVPDLPADARETCQSCLAGIETATVRRDVAAEQKDIADQELAEITVPEALTKMGNAIGALRDRKSVIADYVADIPRRCATREAEMARLRILQTDLGWPHESANETAVRLPPRTKSAELRELVEKRGRLDERRASAVKARTEASEELTRLSRRSEALGPPVDVSAAMATSRRLRAGGDLQALAAKARRAADQLDGQLQVSLSGLAPWTGPIEALRVERMPEEAEIAGAAEALERSRRDVDRWESAVADAQTQVDSASLELRQRLQDGGPVLPEAVGELRGRRDDLWSGIRLTLVEKRTLDDPSYTIDRYEAEVEAADHLSDRRTETSEAAALALARQRDLEAADLHLRHMRERCEGAVQKRTEAEHAWSLLVRFVDAKLDVPAFQGWRRLSQEALALSDRLIMAHEEAVQAETTFQQATAEAQALAEGLSVAPEDRSLASLLDEVDARIGAATAKNSERASLNQLIDMASAAVERAKNDLEGAEADLDSWDTAWAARVSEANLGEGESFSLVKERLALLDEVREISSSIVDLERRIESMEGAIDDFSGGVSAIAASADVDVPDNPDCLIRLASLVAALDDGKREERRRAELIETRTRAAKAVADAEADMRTAEAKLRPLMDTAGLSKPRELSSVVERCARARVLSDEISALEDEVISAGGGGSVAELVELVESVDPNALVTESERIDRELIALRTRLQELAAEKQRTETLFREIDDGPDAAMAEADLAHAIAEMGFQAETYIERRAEAVLLRWAMERFRRERQAPLLRAASDIFSRLTLGRYIGLDVELEGKDGHLIGLLADGSRTVPAARMSDGTADQLYLALRIAAIREAVAGGAHLPFIADDLFINYDDERAAAGFRELLELARVTQVLFMTHHEHLLSVASQAIAPLDISSCTLAQPPVAAVA